jgi:hypothetical protein
MGHRVHSWRRGWCPTAHQRQFWELESAKTSCHYGGVKNGGTRSRKWGSFVIGRKTIKKRLLRTLEAVKVELRKRMHDPIVETGTWVWQMLNGRLNYFAVSGNDKSL